MLEGLVAWVLNNYLGKYVENLNTDQLSIALLQGEVELENLPLKKGALRHFGLPIEIRAGFIGKIKLQIPVRQIRSAPWVILIEQLCVVTGPYRLSEWDEEVEELASQDYKLGILDEVEARWRAKTDNPQESNYYASSYSSWMNYGTGLVANIVENLQLKIKDVHIRFEDDETTPGNAFALGVIIESLSAQSCDDKWMPRFSSWDSGNMSFKLLELNALSVYLDFLTSEQLLGSLSLGDLAVAMSVCAAEKHSFILAPVSAQAHVKRNRSEQPLRSRTQPRIVCDLHLEEVPLTLVDWQYGMLVTCLKGLRRIERARRHRKWRPEHAVAEGPRAWWKYALLCRFPRWRDRERTEAERWALALQRARDNVCYVDAYARVLASPTAALPADLKALKECVEAQRDLDELRALRECAMWRMHLSEPTPNGTSPSNGCGGGNGSSTNNGNSAAGRGVLLQWFPLWWGWYSSSSDKAQSEGSNVSSPTESFHTAPAEFEEELLDALADTVENNTLLRRDTVFGQFNFTLKKGAFNLCTSKGDHKSESVPVIELQFDTMQLGWESRPRTGSHKFHITLGAMYLVDHYTQDSEFRVLIRPENRRHLQTPLGRGTGRPFPPGLAKLLSSSGRTPQPDEPLFTMSYEFRPFNSNIDYRLHINSQSLDVVYNPAAIKWLSDFFTRPHQKPDAQLRQAARQRYEVMKQKTKEELIKNWEQILEGDLMDRKIWDIKLDISAPQIMLLENFCDKNALIVVVDFGKFYFSNQPDTPAVPKGTSKETESDEEDNFQTPCSTPPGSEASESESSATIPAVNVTTAQKTDELFSSNFSEAQFHQKLYDRYTMELGDLQILVGRVRDNWKYAHLKGTSTLHVLDRFNISLTIERRVVYMNDPHFPSLRLTGNLPKLVVHVNEQKVDALRTMAALISGKGLPSPFRSQSIPHEEEVVAVPEQDASFTDIPDTSGRESQRLLMLQFSVDQLALEVQSRGRSIAELQVSGVRAAYTRRTYDTILQLSVHSLLLVDALQTYGPDFELLVASHKHVGMDSVSGSLRDSEPTSPTSPGSPDPSNQRAAKATSPIALTQALSSLQTDTPPWQRAVSPTFPMPPVSPPGPTSPPPSSFTPFAVQSQYLNCTEVLDAEALISIEIWLVSPKSPDADGEALQTASIQFNNLDIIANQETIVELVGFARRVFPPSKPFPKRPLVPPGTTMHQGPPSASNSDTPARMASPRSDADSMAEQNGAAPTRTELTFDFHRLNVLLLRAVYKEGTLVGRKIATATMSEAMIQATVGSELSVQGSLGGLQVLDQTPEGQKHQRILSLGKDPLIHRSFDLVSCLNAEIYSLGQQLPPQEEARAFSFSVHRSLESLPRDCADIKIRMASVWYTHSPRLITELQSCATEFKQYLSNLARSIRSAATEMAIGLVHARAEALAQSLYMNSRLSSSFYGGSVSEVSSPRRRRRSSVTQSNEMLETVGSTRGTTPHTPFSPSDDEYAESFIDIRLDVILDSPVVVLPRQPSSPQVFVAHLGKISVSNSSEKTEGWEDDVQSNKNNAMTLEQELWGMGRHEHYFIEIRDMNLYSLNTENRVVHDTSHGSYPTLDVPLMRPEKFYSCAEDGKPILHNTIIKLQVDRDIGRSFMRQSDSFPTVLMGHDAGTEFHKLEQQDLLHISGRVESALKVSLSRDQYEQLLDTVESLLSQHRGEDEEAAPEGRPLLSNIEEEESDFHSGVSTLKMDPTVRAKMLNIPSSGINRQKTDTRHVLSLKVLFSLPVLTVELKGDLGSGERGLVDVSFRDFNVQYERCDEEETNIQMSLRSLLMEDLSFEPDSKHRCIVVSTAVAEPEMDAAAKRAVFMSKSCPNLANHIPIFDIRSSLPDRLEADPVFKMWKTSNKSATPARPSQRVKTVAYPCTPPPSPRPGSSPVGMRRYDNLVHLNVLLLTDPITKTVRRTVTVDFNSLDIIVNMESWAVILDFFGVGSTQNSPPEEKSDTQHTSASDDFKASEQGAQKLICSEMYIDVRSFTLVLNRLNYEVARANISNLTTSVKSNDHERVIEGRLGSISLLDLSPHGQMYCERFVTSGSEALHFHMIRYLKDDPNMERECDSRLSIEMSSVIYVHTRRFVSELQAFFYRFSQLRGVVASIRSATTGSTEQEHRARASRMLLELHAGSPVILLPLSARSTDVLIADLGKLSVKNRFMMSDAEGTLGHRRRQSGRMDTSAQKDAHSPDEPPAPCLLDVMQVDLENMDLYSGGVTQPPASPVSPVSPGSPGSQEQLQLRLSTFTVEKRGAPLLKEKCHLRLQVERNLETLTSHHVPDLFINGKLSALHGSIDLSQYKLIRGLLAYNLGEATPDLDADFICDAASYFHTQVNMNDPVWALTSIYLDLEDVTVKLQLSHGTNDVPESSLAGINFIKSRLVVETFSDGSRDIDLESREILITDTRYQAEPVNKRSNVFTNILQPINMAAKKNDVQAEVHHRRNQGFSKFAVLLKDIRLMVILDWWEAVRNFIMDFSDDHQIADDPAPRSLPPVFTPKPSTLVSTVGIVTKCPPVLDAEKAAFELKLNITSSEMVLVEDTSQWDTNAVILKSNSIIMYRPQLPDKPLSCDLNHCELFSCILGMEDETALSIVDPAQICIEVARHPSTIRGIADVMTSAADRVLEVHSKDLTVRLSYHDMCMFTRILSSLPKQTLWARSQDAEKDTQPANIRNQVKKLVALGFHPEDCLRALNQCNGLDDAALWLTQNAAPVDASSHQDVAQYNDSPLSFESISVDMACVRVVVIDDCRDADVPLLEMLLARLQVQQSVGGRGTAACQFSCDYFNRTLSGWEPFIEPWGCEIIWEHTNSPNSPVAHKSGLLIHVSSNDLLNVNVTSTFIELYQIVKENWLQDYNSVTSRDRCAETGSLKHMGSPPGYRRRLPFVPYAIRNNTGSPLWFTTRITSADTISGGSSTVLEVDESWVCVEVDATIPFTFEGREKVRHRNTHKQNIHQLAVKVKGWCAATPVTVDKVGIYFRQARPDAYHASFDMPQARLVFEVTLDGSAKKLVTVRSALVLCNKLEEQIEVKMESPSFRSKGPSIKTMHLSPGSSLPVPLTHIHALLSVRPLDRSHPGGQFYQFCNKPLDWTQVTKPGDIAEEIRVCHSNRDHIYRFCAAVHREHYPPERIPGVASHNLWVQPAHSITLLSPLSVTNLLPHELHFNVKDSTVEGIIKPGSSLSLQQVDLEHSVELVFWLENYPGAGSLVVPPGAGHLKTRVRLQDVQGRRLLLQAYMRARRGGGLTISLSSPFWIFNKTSLPLVFRQEGVPTDTAGQGEEHEVARMVAPLLFSFADHEASPSVMARIGNGVHPDGLPQWCQNFFLHSGIQVRRLRVALRDGRPDLVYVIGISVRPGRGRYRHTSVVTLTPRFQLHNRSSFVLQFSQRCFATTLNDPGAKATYLTAVPDCCLAFHWPRLDKDQLLCARLLDIPDCLWSGGFLIESNSSMHINIRDRSGRMYFLHIEVVLQEAMYFIVFTDADTMPPPLRIDNIAAVPLTFHQSCVTSENLHTIVRPYSSLPYCLDEPTQLALITLHAPGGACAEYDLRRMGEGASLTYENFIYIAFTGTFGKGSGCGSVLSDPLDVQSQQLVLEVPEGTARVVLARKEQGKRSQLWRMTGDGHLQHEGSSPPREPRARTPPHSDYTLVLDIAGPAPQPSHYVSLELRRPDRRRTSTQTWRFTDDGRLCCAHNNMCVQAKDGFFGLHQGGAGRVASWQMWSEAVLGPPQPQHHQVTLLGVPLEQAVSRQRLRPGSGFLSVRVLTDGPTRVLQVKDLKEGPVTSSALALTQLQQGVVEDRHWPLPVASLPITLHSPPADVRELQIQLKLPVGIGVSLVSRQPPEELLFAHFSGIEMEALRAASQLTLSLQVQDVQVDNQLHEAQCPVVVHVSPTSSKHRGPEEDHYTRAPALQLSAEKLASPNLNAEIYKHLIIKVKNLSMNIEERLLLKLFAFVGFGSSVNVGETPEENDIETQRIVMEAASVNATRYYFGSLRLEPSQVRLSVFTTSKLPPQLQSIKKKLGLTLIKFEDAAVDLKPFVRVHPFESSQFLLHSIIKHFKDELMWQAAIILGSVDFLGNPLGLVNDVSEGMSGLIFEGNVSALLKNVTHGLSNSAAKVTESLSDGLGRVIMDEQHEETRQRIRALHSMSSGDHLIAGFKGLGFGLLGGFTSVFRQTYEGATTDGMQGFFSGLGKGLVGTVTKPVVGVLDLASETASAVRDSSRSSHRLVRRRYRSPRCVVGPSGLLPVYDKQQSEGQELLYSINERNYSEVLVWYDSLLSGPDGLRVLVSSERVLVFTASPSGGVSTVLQSSLGDLAQCSLLTQQSPAGGAPTTPYIELCCQDMGRRPRVRCDESEVAKRVVHYINYAKSMFEERRHTVFPPGDNILED